MVTGSGCSSGWYAKGVGYKDFSIGEIGVKGSRNNINEYPSYIPHRQILFNNKCGYTIKKKTSKVELRSDEIKHIGPEGMSATLKLALWATKAPYNGTSLTGRILGEAKLGQLKNGASITNITRTVHYTAPPDGTYHMTLAIQEWENGAWSLRDTCIFEGRKNFPI